MELKINVEYEQILNLIHQLSKNDKEKIASILQSEIAMTSPQDFYPQIILDAPTWSEVDYKNYLEARNHLNSSRIS